MTKKLSKEVWLSRFKKIHGDKYDYSLFMDDSFEYKGKDFKIPIICNKKDVNGDIHGKFYQSPAKHYRLKEGCPKCNSGAKLPFQYKEKIANYVHNEKYNYDWTTYKSSNEPFKIICPIHGEFWQTYGNHVYAKQGCPLCKQSKLEEKIGKALKEHNISFERQKTFPWLKYKRSLYLDFYLPDYNIAIECQGEQHFRPFRFETDDNKLILRKERDKIKLDECHKNGIDILYFSDYNYDASIITDFTQLLRKILSHGQL